MRRPGTIGKTVLGVALCVLSGVARGDDKDKDKDTSSGKLLFNRDIRPILSENCFACHGPDSASRKANLRLDKREAAIEAGAIEPGDTEGSELLARITATDRDQIMPPPA